MFKMLTFKGKWESFADAPRLTDTHTKIKGSLNNTKAGRSSFIKSSKNPRKRSTEVKAKPSPALSAKKLGIPAPIATRNKTPMKATKKSPSKNFVLPNFGHVMNKSPAKSGEPVSHVKDEDVKDTAKALLDGIFDKMESAAGKNKKDKEPHSHSGAAVGAKHGALHTSGI